MEELNFDDSIDSFPTVLSNFLELMQVQESVSKKTASPTIGFIPINLNLSMVGLSGMKIYQKFSINQNFLPSNYEETLEFLLKGITQTVNDKGWTTSIEALSIPLSVSSGASPSLSYTQPPLTTTETGTSYTAAGVGPQATSAEVASSQLTGVTPGKCGVKVIANNIPGLNKPTDTLRKTALQASYDAVFYGPKENKPSPYMCGRWTYNLAYNYTQALNKKPLSKGANLSAGGNANEASYWANLVKLGYTQYVAAKNASKAEITSLVNGKIQFNLGDVVVYFSNDTPTKLHTQMYIGTSQIKEVKGGQYPNKSGWVTDNYSNYSTSFVYNKNSNNCYNLLVFRAPIDSGVIVDTNQSRNAYIKIAQELNKILTLQDKFYRADGTALLSDAKGKFNDDEQLAINHLNEVLGFSVTNQNWKNKLQPQYQLLSPADKKLFDSEYNKLKELIKNNSTNANASTNFLLPLSTDPKTNKFITVVYNF